MNVAKCFKASLLFPGPTFFIRCKVGSRRLYFHRNKSLSTLGRSTSSRRWLLGRTWSDFHPHLAFARCCLAKPVADSTKTFILELLVICPYCYWQVREGSKFTPCRLLLRFKPMLVAPRFQSYSNSQDQLSRQKVCLMCLTWIWRPVWSFSSPHSIANGDSSLQILG